MDGYKDTTQRSSGIISYEVSGKFETCGIVHNLIAGIQYLDVDNDNDRYNADFTPNNNSDSDTATNIARPINISGGYGSDANGSTYNQGYEGANSALTTEHLPTLTFFPFTLTTRLHYGFFDPFVGCAFRRHEI